jgi:hypothetical protein
MTAKYFQDSLDEFISHGFEAFSVSCAVTVARKATEGFIPWFSWHRDDGQCVVSLLGCSTTVSKEGCPDSQSLFASSPDRPRLGMATEASGCSRASAVKTQLSGSRGEIAIFR